MILDPQVAGRLYTTAAGGDSAAVGDFHDLCSPLIGAIAASVDASRYADLVQEGHLKLQLVLTAKTFDATRGSIYSFLSVALRNHMVDYVRANSGVLLECDLEPVGLEGVAAPVKQIPIDYRDMVCYIARRFPLSLASGLANEVAEYTVYAMVECCNGSCKGAVKTLSSVYPVPRHVASIVCRASLSVCRMEHAGMCWRNNIDAALGIVHKRSIEISLLPEVVLAFGLDATGVMRGVFNGAYIKF